MAAKEIAELCGVSSETVRRWTHTISDLPQNVGGDPGKNFQGLTSKKDDLLQNAKGSDDLPKNLAGLSVKLEEAHKSGKDPADFTLDETFAIIGEGGKNRALASLLAENTVTKNTLTVQSDALTKTMDYRFYGLGDLYE
jgi:hypothetical protein